MKEISKNNILKFRSEKKKKQTSKSKGYALYNEGLYFFNKDVDDVALEKFLAAEQEGYITAEMLADIAYIYGESEEDEKSFSYIKRAIEADNAYGYAHYYIRRFYNESGDKEKELEHLLLAEKYGYTDKFLYPFISTVYNYEPFCDYLKAYEYANKAIKLYPNESYSYLNKGLLLYDRNEYEKALPYLEKAEKLGDNSESTFFQISYCYGETGNLPKAIEYANKAIFLNKTNWMGYYRKAFTYFMYDDFEHAKEAFLLAEKYECVETDMYSALAYSYVYCAKPDFDKAMEYANKALALNKKDFFTYLAIACAYLQLREDYKTAKKYFRKYLKMNVADSLSLSFYSNYGYALCMTHQYKKAEIIIDEGLKLYEDTALITQKIQVCYYYNKYKKAYRYVQKLYNLDRTCPNNIFAKVVYYFNIKDHKKCIKYCQKISDKDIPEILILKSITFFNLKDYDSSIQALEKFIKNHDLSEIWCKNYKTFKKFIKDVSKKFPDLAILNVIQDKYGDILAKVK